MSVVEYLADNPAEVLGHALDHLVLVTVAMTLGTALGLTVGVLSYRRPRARAAAIRVSSVILTIPSLALIGLLFAVPVVGGLGAPPVVAALTLYSLLPIVRNTIVGLNGVDPAVVESAQAMGMSARQRLVRVELPLAWPVIAAGVRVSTLIVVGIAAIGAVFGAGGLGAPIFDGLNRVGTPVALPLVLSGLLGVVVLGVLLDALFALLIRVTTPRGIRA